LFRDGLVLEWVPDRQKERQRDRKTQIEREIIKIERFGERDAFLDWLIDIAPNYTPLPICEKESER
jgi:hypothetical protein